jgi:hypothetical protein
VAQGLCLRCLGGSLGESLNCHFRGGAGVSAVWVCVCVCVCVCMCACVCVRPSKIRFPILRGVLVGFFVLEVSGAWPQNRRCLSLVKISIERTCHIGFADDLLTSNPVLKCLADDCYHDAVDANTLIHGEFCFMC